MTRVRTAVPGRLGVLGDIHACQERLAGALRAFESAGVGAVLAVGDLADGPGDLDACVRMLDAAGAIVVSGNHDRWLLEGTLRDLPDAHHLPGLGEETVAWLRDLPAARELEADGVPLTPATASARTT